MTKPILYYNPGASPSRSIAFVIKALNLDVEYKVIDTLKGEQFKPELLKINPQHTVPTLVDSDGFVIWDSHAIITYLAEKYDKTGTLYPKDLRTRATINQRLHYESSVISQKWFNFVRPLFDRSVKEFSEEVIKGANEVYDLLEIFLKDGYIVGNKLTVADYIIAATVCGMVRANPANPSKHAKLIDWLKRISELPYYNETNGNFVEGLQYLITSKLEENRKQ